MTRCPSLTRALGNAADTSATAGTAWRAHLSPDLTGTWTYTVSFTEGANVAVDGGGSAVAPYDGTTGTFEVWGTPNCGKGEPNQMIHVGHASPPCVFRDIDVFGGGA